MDVSRNCRSFLSEDEKSLAILKNVITNASNAEFLDALSVACLDPPLADTVLVHFHELALELIARWKDITSIESIATLGHILPLLPGLSRAVLDLLHDHAAPLDLLQHLPSVQSSNPQTHDEPIKQLLLGVLRLITLDGENFSRIVKPARVQLLLSHSDRSIRYLAVRILCAFAGASDNALEDALDKHLGDEEITGEWEGRSIDYKFWPLWEEKRQLDFRDRLERVDLKCGSPLTTLSRILTNKNLSPKVTILAGMLFVSRNADQSQATNSPPLISTPTVERNLARCAQALQRNSPVLITGAHGSGKTHMINHISRTLGYASSMMTLHLNEQTDAKLLVGIYASGSTPGTFEWKPGVLTTAVREGRWVFIEDLDRAPNDVLGTILPLIENRQLHIPSRGETIRAAASFRIIATMQTHINIYGEEIMSKPGMLGERLWERVYVEQLNLDELRQVAMERSTILDTTLTRLIAVYQSLEKAFPAPLLKNRSPVISPRQWLKWCDRISTHLKTNHHDTAAAIDEGDLDAIFLDATDCFAGHLDDAADHLQVASIIAQELHVDPQRRNHLLHDRMIRVKRIGDTLSVGRARVPVSAARRLAAGKASSNPFAMTKHSLRLLERVALACRQGEPVLLVGETGIGKTTVVQHLATLLNHEILAINLSQQSESGDLLGGYKPVSIRSLAIPLKDEFDVLFERSFSSKKNEKFTQLLNKSITKGQWKRAVTLWREALKMVRGVMEKAAPLENGNGEEQKAAKRRKIASSISDEDKQAWASFTEKLDALGAQVNSSSSQSLMFSFVEGKLVNAVREGHWVLLDEINLASPDTLECLSDLLESGPGLRGSLLLAETGNVERITAHPDFRIFGAMNPSNDIGKKDLAPGIKSRFTEIYVQSPDKDPQSLHTIVTTYLEKAVASTPDLKISALVTKIYLDIQELVQQEGLVDGSGQRPVFSLRTLTRTLTYAAQTAARSGIRRALYEGFALCFFTTLDEPSEAKIQDLVQARLFGTLSSARQELKKHLRQPDSAHEYVQITLQIQALKKGKRTHEEQCWLPRGALPPTDSAEYIITPYICRNLQNLIRATSSKKFPVLIQGPTSAGKTSMVEYLAKRSGNRFVRINNHEHTDLQEYLGTYISTTEGQIVFQEGILVEALRKGHWVVLDELNLAPTDVLEALNRLLDENRELLIPETQEIVRPHPSFMLFATQNPAGPYGGRKQLSRAFRNRFLELHFDDIPIEELQIILSKRAELPESRCSLIVEVYRRLSQLRQESRVFEQHSFATLRDLFRWAFRDNDTIEKLAYNGYMLLAEKVRKYEERMEVKRVIESTMSRKGVKISIAESVLYDQYEFPQLNGLVWTKAMKRLYMLVKRAVDHNEAVLLVGETGCGKTTICQILSQHFGKELFTVNAHQNLETGDLIGAQRPLRNRAAIEAQLQNSLVKALIQAAGGSSEIVDLALDDLLNAHRHLSLESLMRVPTHLKDEILALQAKRKTLFEWQDGSIIQAMRTGQYFLLDEISLADDSVLERLNSVLDPQRTILLAEKGSNDSLVTAKAGFQFFATMNPGGDYGKKELSPALRNRFTEIWVPPMTDLDDVLEIVRSKLGSLGQPFASSLVEFGHWFDESFHPFKESSVSIRDMLAWIHFINASKLEVKESIVHGAAMVYFDTLGANPSAMITLDASSIKKQRLACLEYIGQLLRFDALEVYNKTIHVSTTDSSLIIGEFSISRAASETESPSFTFDAPTSRTNAMRIIRSLQLDKPILLEGSPGVGKTSLVAALASAVGKSLTRINLSEQTDLMDLFGSDVPVDGAEAGVFAWRDASFLAAMKSGGWVLLDEMNLASQSVLEGLNACLDHRGEAYIAELHMVFKRHSDFRLFAAQNPHSQGGGRKGLPASFVNRFSVVYADVLDTVDLYTICQQSFPDSDVNMMKGLVAFVNKLDTETTQIRSFGQQGAPWEFNLRDTLRCLQLMTADGNLLPATDIQACIDILFSQRFRSQEDRRTVRAFASKMLGTVDKTRSIPLTLSQRTLQVGLGLHQRETLLLRSRSSTKLSINGFHEAMEAILVCIQQKWPVILAGASASGKSRLIDSLATATGRHVEVFPLSADIDATDLVGGYEQIDHSRDLYRLAETARQIACEAMLTLSLLADSVQIHALQDLCNLVKCDQTSLGPDGARLLHATVVHLAEAMPDTLFVKLELEIRTYLQNSHHAEAARFQWVDGSLVKALERGDWLVLDNANLCSPSVLDRLNALLEPGGTLIINENCSIDGQPKVVTPHPDFRIFLTMDPRNGEVSRAMRNRAVEIFLPQNRSPATRMDILLESALTGFHLPVLMSRLRQDYTAEMVKDSLENSRYQDIKLLPRFLKQVQSGLVVDSLVPSFIENGITTLSATRPNQDWYRRSFSVYEAISTVSQIDPLFAMAQSLNPLNNETIANHSRKLGSNDDIDNYAFVHETFIDMARFEHTLASLQSNNISHDFDVAHRQELQYKLIDFKSRNVSKERTAQVLLFFASSHQDIVAFISKQRILERDASQIRTLLLELLFCRWDLLETVSDAEFDDARYLAQVQICSSSLNRYQITDSEIFQFSSKQISDLRSLDTTKPSKTGLSMHLLWNMFRPKVASSMEQLQKLLEFESIVEQFDNIIRKTATPVRNIEGLRASIKQVMQIIITEDSAVDDLILGISTALNQKMDGNETEGEDRPVFQDAFKILVQSQDLMLASSRAQPKMTLPDTVSILAGQPTLDSSRQDRLGSTASLLRSISRYVGTGPTFETPINSGRGLGLVAIRQLQSSVSTSIRAMSLLADELLILGKCISEGISILCSSHSQHLAKAVLKLSDDVVAAHENLSEDRESIVAKASGNINDNPTPTKDAYDFASIKTRYLKGRDEMSHDSVGGKTDAQRSDLMSLESQLQSAERIVRVALGCLYLYVPEKPHDPALRANIAYEMIEKRRSSMTAKMNVLRSLESLNTGAQDNQRLRRLETDLENLDPLEKPIQIPRPKISRILDMQPEFNAVLRILQRSSQILAQDNDNVSGHEDIQQDLAQIIRRLKHQQVYRDIVEPMVDWLNCLRLGLDYMKTVKGRMQDSQVFKLRNDPLSGVPLFGDFDAVAKPFRREDSLRHQIHLLACLEVRTESNGLMFLSEEDCENLTASFSSFFQVWKIQLKKDQQEDVSASRLYTYRGDAEMRTEDDEAELEALFPNYDTRDPGVSDPQVTNGDSPRQLATRVARSHLNIFLSDEKNSKTVRQLVSSTVEYIVAENGRDQHRPTLYNDETLVCLSLIGIYDRRKTLAAPAIDKKQYNIYTDANIGEASKAATLVRKVIRRTNEILETWPEHATLHNIIGSCNELLSIAYSEPVMKIIQSMEKLHAFLAQWQSVASREFSAEPLYDEVTQLVVDWRRLELSTWAQLLDVEQRKSRSQALEWWFPVFENAIYIPWMSDPAETSGENLAHLLASLELFIVGSSAGQYVHRLNMLKSVFSHANQLASSKTLLRPISVGLNNIIQHYSRFQASVNNFLEEGRKKLDKDLKELLQLASWKDTNVEALKQSSRTSHRKLFRTVKKFRELLAKPVSPFLVQDTEVQFRTGLPNQAEKDQSSNLSLSIAEMAQDQCKKGRLTWHTRPKRYQNIPALVSVMRSKAVASDSSLDVHVTLHDFGSETLDAAEKLRKATPQAAKDENAALIKHLTSRKRRLFADTLKEIRNMGFFINQSPTLLQRQNSTAKVLAILPMTKTSDRDLHCVLDQMSKVRESLREHNEDLNTSDVGKCVGFLEHILMTSIEQRQVIGKHVLVSEHLNKLIGRISTLWNADGLACKVQTGNSSADSLTISNCLCSWVRWIMQSIAMAAEVLEAQASMGNVDFAASRLLEHLREWSYKFKQCKDQMQNAQSTFSGLVTMQMLQLQTDLKDIQAGLIEDLSSWQTTYPQAAKVLSNLQRCLEQMPALVSTQTRKAGQLEQSSSDSEPERIQVALLEVLDSMLASIQDVHERRKDMPESTESAGWLMEAFKVQRSNLAAYQSQRTLDGLDKVTRMFSPIDDEATLSRAAATVISTLPVIVEYHRAYSIAIAEVETTYTSLTRTLHQLAKIYNTLSASGFCKPAPPSDESDKGRDDKLEAGTGLGEGEGAENISKDIGEDEDLEELAQEENADADPDNHDDSNDDAVSIDGDLKNQKGLDDAGENGEEQEEKQPQDEDADADEETDAQMGDDGDAEGAEGQDEGQSNMDEGVGDVDDLEPTAIDEKMWDQAADEQLKEKEGNQDAKSQEKKENAASSEKETGKKEDGEAGGNDADDDQAHSDDEDDLGSLDDNETAAEDADGAGAPDMAESMDPHIKETDTLDLPEDMQLDGDKGEAEDDEDMDGMEDFPDEEPKKQEMEDLAEEAIDETDAKEQEQEDQIQTGTEDVDDAVNKMDEGMDINDQAEPTEGDNGDDEAADQGTSGERGQHDQPHETANQVSQGEQDNNAEDSATDPQTSMTASRSGQQRQAAQPQPSADGEEVSESQRAEEEQDSASDNRFQKLGDFLEQWHRQQREIKQASSADQGQQEQQDIDMADIDFEHVPDEDDQGDTQALGPSNEDEARAIDQSLALPSNDKDEGKTKQQDEFEADEMEHEEESAQKDSADQNEEAMQDMNGDITNANESRVKIGSPSQLAIDRNRSQQLEEEMVDDNVPSQELSALDIRTPGAQTAFQPSSQWASYEARTSQLASGLTEQLRLILTPTLATKLRGDFRTGKRLNIKRIIPYIASSYKRDKIWMRRSVPSKRAYQILLCIDDSRSMQGDPADLAFQTLALVGRALAMLEAGEIGVLSFGQTVSVAHPLGHPLTSAAGDALLQHFSFTQDKTDVRKLVATAIEQLQNARTAAGPAAADLWQLQLIISDGICEDHEGIRRLLLRAQEQRIMIVFVVVDSDATATATSSGRSAPQKKQKQSITDLERVDFVEGPADARGIKTTQVKRTRYLDTFPFGYWLLVRHVGELPGILSQALRQWFAEVAER